MLSDSRLDEIAVRTQAAPMWTPDQSFERVWEDAAQAPETAISGHIDLEMPEVVAEFIAHARTDIPDLLGEVERLRAENERLRQEADR